MLGKQQLDYVRLASSFKLAFMKDSATNVEQITLRQIKVRIHFLCVGSSLKINELVPSHFLSSPPFTLSARAGMNIKKDWGKKIAPFRTENTD